MSVQGKSFLVYDLGLFSSFAERLASQGNPVGYFVPHESGFADGRELAIGQGLEGVTRIKYWDDAVDDYDCLVFPDVSSMDLQTYYRKHGYRVWGSGRGAELELLRWKTKELMAASGLPVHESYKVEGTTKLRQFFKDHSDGEGWFVKVSGLRGLGETWMANDYVDAKPMIDYLDSHNGPLAELIFFIVEKCIPDSKEIGYDGYSIDGQFPNESMWGAEQKDKAYFGMVSRYEDLPKEVQAVNDGLSETMAKLQYRNFFSSELRDEFCIDPSCRHASPAGEVIVHNMENLPEVVFEGAIGQMVQPKFTYKYGAQIILSSEWARENYLTVRFPEEIRTWVKLYYHARLSGPAEIGTQDYFIPQMNPQYDRMKEFGSVIALSDDPDEAISTCKERASQVQAMKCDYDEEALDKAYEEMQSFVEV